MFPFSDRCGDNDGMTIALRTALNCHPQKMEFSLFESSKSQIIKGTIHLGRRQIFTIFDPYRPPSAVFFTIIRR
jgi:hypothetical protein